MTYADAIGAEPGRVTTPSSADEVAEAVRKAYQGGKSIIPWGGGTGQTYGYLPARADTLLDTSRLNRILAHEPGDLTVTVEGGTTLAAVQDALAAHNQYLPLDPPHESVATVGGILATDAFGASRLTQGTARDWLIGISVIDGQGRLVKGGGKVVKNVTGYDLPKLHIGAMGTLGVIVEATFKIAPRPEAFRGLMFTGEAAFVSQLHEQTQPALSLLRETVAGRILAVIYSGYEEVVASHSSMAIGLAAEIGASQATLPPRMPPPFTGTPPLVPLIARVTGPLDTALTRHDALIAMGVWNQVDTFPGAGHADAYLAADADPERAWRTLVEWGLRNGVQVAALHAPLEMRRDYARVGLWSPLPPTFPLMQRLKATLDPERVLNPGRFLGGI